jgi:hypothetical protein
LHSTGEPTDALIIFSVRSPAQPSHRIVWAGVTAGLMLAASICYSVALHRWVVGSVEGGWTYPYARPFTLHAALIFAGIAFCATFLLAIPATRRTTHALLLVWILFATGAHWLLRTTAPFDLETVFLSPGAYSFYTLAQERRPGEILAKFNRIRPEMPPHAQSNMPGKTILVHALEMVSTRTDVLPWLLVILSNVGAVLMFMLARDLFNDDRVALYAAVLYLFTPARVFFFPLMNVVTPVFVLVFAWLLMRSLLTGRSCYAGAAGMALYALVFFEPLPLVMGLLFTALVIAAIARGDVRVQRCVVQAAVMVLVFVAAGLAVYELTNFHILRAFKQISEHAVEFNEVERRSYAVWVRANLVEFMFAAGPLQLVLAVTAMAARRPAAPLSDWLSSPIVATSFGLFAVLITTDLIGINRGEVTRLWIFLACFFQLPAAYLCAALSHTAAMAAVLTMTLLQVCIATAVIGFVVP